MMPCCSAVADDGRRCGKKLRDIEANRQKRRAKPDRVSADFKRDASSTRVGRSWIINFTSTQRVYNTVRVAMQTLDVHEIADSVDQ